MSATRLRPMPRTARAIEVRVRCVLHDRHPAMARGISATAGCGRVSLAGGVFTEEEIRDALGALPWRVDITRHGIDLVITPAEES